MDPRLQEMLDHHEIRQMLATYCHGCDRCDEVEMASTYCDDSWDDHGARKLPGKDFSIATIAQSLDVATCVSHLLGQSLIRVDGDTAGAETYFLATVVRPDTGEGKTVNQLGGRYVDTLVREDGKWLVKSRVCVRDWSITLPVDLDWQSDMGFTPGRRDGADVSYGVLGLVHAGNPWLPSALTG